MRSLVLGIVCLLLVACSNATMRESEMEWVAYRSADHGFVLWYPSSWTFDDSRGTGPAAIRIDAPNGEAVFIVSLLQDPRLTEADGLEQVLADIREGFDQDPRYTVDGYDESSDYAGVILGDYIAFGSFLEGTIPTRFKEMGTMLSDGRFFVITAHLEESASVQSQNILDEMIGSFDPLGVD